MSLLNLRANFNTTTSSESKLQVLEKFEGKNPGKFFYLLTLSEEYRNAGVHFDFVDKEFRANLLPEMVIADVVTVGGTNKLVGGLYFGNLENIKESDLSLQKCGLTVGSKFSGKTIKIEKVDMRDEVVEQTILAALQNVMRTPTVDI